MKDLKGLKIHCDTQEEKKELLEEATKQGYVWYASGCKPLKFVMALNNNNYHFDEDMTITHSADDCISYKEYKAMSVFTKADLKPCMVVVLKDGSVNIVTQYKKGIALIDDNDTWDSLNRYSDDLHCKGNDNYDILQIYGFSDCIYDSMKISIIDRPLLWERKEETEMSISDAEEELSKLSGKKYKIVKE